MAGVCVFGAANVDIGGFPNNELRLGDSNPGRIHISVGGVGYNIACNASRLGLHTEFCAALGGDSNADLVERTCLQNNIGLAHAIRLPEERMSVYLYLTDAHGEMHAGVNDMEIVKSMTPEALLDVLPLSNDISLIALDANLPQETIEFLCREIQLPIFAEAVSAAKATRLQPVLSRLTSLKLNAIEAYALTGKSISSIDDAISVVRQMIDAGVRRVFLTLGARGVCYGEGSETDYMPPLPCAMVNTSGAGDAFAASLIWAWDKQLSLADSAAAGTAAAAITLGAHEAVSESICEAAILTYIERIHKITGGEQHGL